MNKIEKKRKNDTNETALYSKLFSFIATYLDSSYIPSLLALS